MPFSSGQLEKGLNIDGGTDGTPIGNTGDRLHVSPRTSSKFRTVFAAPAQVITGSSYVQIFNYSGSGLFFGTTVNANQDGFQLRILIDGTETIVSDISGSQLNSAGLLGGSTSNLIMVRLSAGVIAYVPTLPIPYTSSIQLAGKRDNAGSVTVDSYIVHLTKET